LAVPVGDSSSSISQNALSTGILRKSHGDPRDIIVEEFVLCQQPHLATVQSEEVSVSISGIIAFSARDARASSL
jgi:hypothetical protein